MNYDFDKVWERAGHDAMKWEFPRYRQSSVYTTADSIIPMWVADMDFATPDCVTDAIRERMEHPIFGYFGLPQRYVEAVNLWQHTRYGVAETLGREQIMYQNSVLGGLAAFLSAYTLPGENILIHSPTYTGFQNTIRNLARNLCCSELVQDENGVYRMDYEDMEKKIVTRKISVMVFCSPQNPTGRVWEKWEIEKLVDLCAQYGVKIVSDEIWADFITDPACRHIPTQSVSERAREITMALYAPSKTFNIAGLVGAYSVIYNRQMANKISAAAVMTHYNGPNLLSCYALIGGYEGGAEWVDAMNRYIRSNQEYCVDYINENFPGARAYVPQGTYLLWVDVSGCGKEQDELFREVLATGVLPNNGPAFLGGQHLRFNVACPRSLCEDAMRRLTPVFSQH